MRKLLALILVILWAGCAWAFPPAPPSAGGSGSTATDTLWDAAGDLAVGTGANTAGRLAVGGAYYLLHSNGTTPAWTLTLGAAGTPLTAGYFTDLTMTNAIAGSVTGSAATVTDTELAAIQGLTFADASIIQLTGAGAAAVLTSGGSNRLLGSNSDNSALEFKTSLTGLTFGGFTASKGIVSDGSGNLAVTTGNLTLGANLTTATGAVTLTGNAGGSSAITIPNSTVVLPATPIGGTYGATANSIGKRGADASTVAAAGFIEDGTKVDFSALNLVTTGTITGRVPAIVITSAEGAQDGGDDKAILTDSGETWGTNTYVGMTLYNVTDGSSCVVTANDNTTMTCTLAGGTGNDWDDGDVWAVAPGPSQAGSMIYIGAATTILHPATAGYSACYYSTGANTIKVDPQSASMAIYLNGATVGDGDEIDSAGAAGDFICIHNQSATVGRTLGRSGTWTDGGAS